MVYTVDELKQKIVPLAVKYNLPAVYLFGSYARNEATDKSDVDVLIDKTGSKIKSLFDRAALYNDLTEILGKEIDLVTTSGIAQEDSIQRAPMFAKTVDKERIVIYGE